jgi:hypothetical protein
VNVAHSGSFIFLQPFKHILLGCIALFFVCLSLFEYAYFLFIFSGFLAKFSPPAYFQSDLLAGIIDSVGQPFAIQTFKFSME